jgi:hypothetical protein
MQLLRDCLLEKEMFGSNLPAKFDTEKGSQYTVTTDSVLRTKYYDSEEAKKATKPQAKNIFYIDYKLSEVLLQKGTRYRKWRVAYSEHKYILCYYLEEDRDTMLTAEVAKAPAKGLATMDMFLESDGTFSKDDGLHIGHAVATIHSP